MIISYLDLIRVILWGLGFRAVPSESPLFSAHASTCRLTHPKASHPVTTLRAYGFICFFAEVKREYMHH